MKILLPVFLFIIFASGCASLQEVSSEVKNAGEAGNEGTIKTYPIDTNQSWAIAMTVFRWEKTDEREELRDINYPGSKCRLHYEAASDRLKGTTTRRLESKPMT
jgi:hypothetical protein